jgi:hypothetical protein
MHDLYLDCETHPDLRPGALASIAALLEPPGSMSKPETIAKWRLETAPGAAREKWRRTALDPMAGGVYVIGWRIGTGGATCIASRDPRDDGEGVFIENTLAVIASQLTTPGRPGIPRFIGWNHIGFDIPFLAKRCVIHGITPQIKLPLGTRYNGDRVLDLMQAWGGGFRDMVAQADVAAALGLPDVGIDGADLWDAVEAGGVEVAANKCRADIDQLAAIHARMSAVYGLAAVAA